MIENYRLENLNEELQNSLDSLADLIANPQDHIDENEPNIDLLLDCQRGEIQAIVKEIVSLVAYNQGQAKIAEKLLQSIPNPLDISNLEVKTHSCGTTIVQLDGKDVSSYWPGHCVKNLRQESEKLTNYVSMLNS